MSDAPSLDALTAADFRDIQGDPIRLTAMAPAGAPALSMDVGLAEVTEHGKSPASPFRVPFSLLFHGALTPVLPQGMYRLEHDRLGAVELFLVPVGPTGPAEPGAAPAAMGYEAVFG